MNPLIATVKLDVGMGSSNPSIQLYSSTDLSAEVSVFLTKWNLPNSAHSLILHQIRNELKRNKIELQREQEQKESRKGRDKVVDKENIPNNGKKQQQYQQKKFTKKDKITVPYTPIQKLKVELSKMKVHQNASQLQKQKNFISFKRPDRLSKCIKAKLEEKNGYKNASYMTFGKVVEYKLRKIFILLKGSSNGIYLKIGKIDPEKYSFKFLSCLSEFFKQLDEEDVKRLCEDKFIGLALRKGFGQKLIKAYNLLQEV